MKNNTSFREMIRDRCPEVVSLALKWCKAKEKWLDYVYKERVWILKSKKERLKATKALLDLESKHRNFDFKSTIVWENLQGDELKFWKQVAIIVDFFVTNYAYIKNGYNISVESGKSLKDRKVEVIQQMSQFYPTEDDSDEEKDRKSQFVNDLADYLIDCFEGS